MTTPPLASSIVPVLSSLIKDKTILILSASPNSLGARFLEAIKPAEPGLIILGSRNSDKAQQTASELSPVRSAAAEINGMKEQIDTVINSAGSMAAPYHKSVNGFESQLQTNHLSFFLFVNLIMEKLLASKARIVNVSSEGYAFGGIRYSDFNFHNGATYNPFIAYGQGKTGQILLASALATRLAHKGILSYSIQPGHTAGTNLHNSWGPYTIQDFVDQLQKNGHPAAWSRPAPTTLDENLANYMLAAFDPKLDKDNGAYIRSGAVVPLDDMFPRAVDERQQRLCWEFSEKLVGQTFRHD